MKIGLSFVGFVFFGSVLIIFFFFFKREGYVIRHPGNFDVLQEHVKKFPSGTEKKKLETVLSSIEKSRCKEALLHIASLEASNLTVALRADISPYRIWCQQLVAQGVSADTFGGIIRGIIARLGWVIWPLFVLVFLGWSYSVFGLIRVFKSSRSYTR